jgi:hypothetical protein
MALDNAHAVALQLEKVRDKLPLLYERDDFFIGKILKKDADKVSSRAMRIPLKVQPGGNFGGASLDGGDFGRGSGTLTNFATITPIVAKIGVEITVLADKTTDSKEKAIEGVVKMNIADAMAQFRTDLDYQMQTAGNGVLATVSSVSGSAITVNNTPFGARLLREQQNVQVYDSTLTTNRGSMNTTQVQRGLGQTQIVTVDAVPGGTTGTDLIVVGGISGANPVWFNGIPYFHTTSQTGQVLGLNRTLPYMQANGVDAGGAAITVPPARLALNQIRQALGDKTMQKLFWHTHPSVQAGIEELKIQISQIFKGSSGKEDIDLGFAQDTSFLGVQLESNIHADTTRIDLINLETWGRVEYAPLDYLEIDGRKVFPVYGASGGVSAAFLFYLYVGMQTYVDNLRAISQVTNLGLTTGY